MGSFSVVVLGVGDAFSALHYSTALALHAEGQWLLVECPHPLRKILRESGRAAGVDLDIGDLLGTIVTHLHADHCAGLEGMAFYNRFVLAGPPPKLIAHADNLTHLWQHHLCATMHQSMFPDDDEEPHRELSDWFDPIPLDETRPIRVGPFSIECRRTEHLEPTTALKIRAAGRCLSISADTRWDPSLIAWLEDADLVLHEANTEAFIHTEYTRLCTLPEALRAKMMVVHYPDELVIDDAVLPAAQQGMRYEV